MKKCAACQIKFSTTKERCPFCEEGLMASHSKTKLQNYPCLENKPTESYYWKKVLDYSAVFLFLFSVYLNAISWSSHSFLWSLIFNAGLVYLWKILKVTLFEHNYKRIGSFLWQHSISLYTLLFFLDLFLKLDNHIFIIMCPLIILTTIFILLFFTFGNQEQTTQELSFMLLTIISNLVFLTYYLLTKMTINKGMMIFSSYLVVVLLLFYFVFKKNFETQLKIICHYD